MMTFALVLMFLGAVSAMNAVVLWNTDGPTPIGFLFAVNMLISIGAGGFGFLGMLALLTGH